MHQNHYFSNSCNILPKLRFTNITVNINFIHFSFQLNFPRGSHGHDRMVVGITTIYAISAYHH